MAVRPHHDFDILIEFLFHAARFHDGSDLEYQLRLDQMLIRIRRPDILEDIAAPGFIIFLAHGFSPCAIRSASRSLCFINSMSRRGVSRPALEARTPPISQRVHCPERIAPVVLDDFHHSGRAKAGQCFRVAMLAASLRDIERIAHSILYNAGEFPQVLAVRAI